jgi:hypothetical protein
MPRSQERLRIGSGETDLTDEPTRSNSRACWIQVALDTQGQPVTWRLHCSRFCELLDVPGTDFVGTIPKEIQYLSVFAAICFCPAATFTPKCLKNLSPRP